MSRNQIIRLVDRRKEALISGTLRKDTFTEETIEPAYEIRKMWSISGK
jgi:hypothetical protein